MSRLCVKNLPKYVGEERLREFFSQKGEVTDAKLMRTKEGKSRRFAFIGFRTEQEAEEAIKFFNNTYLDTCRISCEVAHKVGDSNVPRPWSRYSAKKDNQLTEKNIGTEDKRVVGLALLDSKGLGTANGTGKNSKSNNVNVDHELQEFLQIMQPRVKSKLWANDSLVPSSFADENGQNEGKGAHLQAGSKKQPTQSVTDMTGGSNKEDKTDQGLSLRGILNETHKISPVKKSQELSQDEVHSDMDYFKSRVKKNWSDSESDEEEIFEREDRQEMDVKEAQMSVAGQEAGAGNALGDGLPFGDSHVAIIENEHSQSGHTDNDKHSVNTGRLFIRNLPYTTNEDELLELFSRHGDVSQVRIVVDKDTKRSKGIGYVHYGHPESALRALEDLDNSIFQGRLLHVMPAKPQNPSVEMQESNIPPGQTTISFKKQREEQRKASEASGDTQAWNSLFIRQDTVVENVARKYGVDKSDVLDEEADDLAVRVALAETHAIAETKKALKNAGVNVVALEEFSARKDNNRRSNHVILVKNLPYSSSEGDLVKMFGKFGCLDKIILPPTRTLALVIFLEAAEARAAFKGLAYKRYKDAPLYLEWAPGDILSPKPASETDKQGVVGREDVKRVVLEQSLEPIPEVEIDPDRVESRSVFVKNLNFKTSDECLKKHFLDNMKKGKIQSVKVQKHQKNGKNMSMGYGFVEFDSVETATDVCKDLQGTVLDGHALILQPCHAKKDDQSLNRVKKDKSSTKLIVRNVAFEATEKDLRQLFGSFGQVRRVRLPKRIDNHRGFAFVEYATKQETENALQALSSTHLYGRHLVIEQAKEGETLEELRARTAAHFVGEQTVSEKKSRKRRRKSSADGGEVEFQEILD